MQQTVCLRFIPRPEWVESQLGAHEWKKEIFSDIFYDVGDLFLARNGTFVICRVWCGDNRPNEWIVCRNGTKIARSSSESAIEAIVREEEERIRLKTGEEKKLKKSNLLAAMLNGAVNECFFDIVTTRYSRNNVHFDFNGLSETKGVGKIMCICSVKCSGKDLEVIDSEEDEEIISEWLKCPGAQSTFRLMLKHFPSFDGLYQKIFSTTPNIDDHIFVQPNHPKFSFYEECFGLLNICEELETDSD